MPRLALAQSAQLEMLETFTLTDYVNIVTFDNNAVPEWKESPLMHATPQNLEKLRNNVELVKGNGGTDFNVAFNMAFKLLSDALRDESDVHRSQCTRHTIFITDGVDYSHAKTN